MQSQVVLAALAIHHVVPEVVTLPEAARTAAAAADALGITPAEIARAERELGLAAGDNAA